MNRDLRETEIIRLAIASQNNDRELFRSILDNYPDRNVLLRGALGVILTMVFDLADDDNTPEVILDKMLLDYTATNMKMGNG